MQYLTVPIDDPICACCSCRRRDVGKHRKRLAPIKSFHRTGSVFRRKLKVEYQETYWRAGARVARDIPVIMHCPATPPRQNRPFMSSTSGPRRT